MTQTNRRAHTELLALELRYQEPHARSRQRHPLVWHHISMLTIILIVVLLMALGGGGWGHSRYGAAGWSPAGIIVLVIAVLWFTGNLHS